MDQGRGEGGGDAPAAHRRPDVEAAQAARRLGGSGLDAERADPRQLSDQERGEDRLAVVLEACAGPPAVGQQGHVAHAFAGGLGDQVVEAVRQFVEQTNQLEHQPGETIFSGRTYWSNSSFDR